MYLKIFFKNSGEMSFLLTTQFFGRKLIKYKRNKLVKRFVLRRTHRLNKVNIRIVGVTSENLVLNHLRYGCDFFELNTIMAIRTYDVLKCAVLLQ